MTAPVRPLEGITVVENASFVAAPSCCLGLSKLGAEVIRIDPIGGGPDFDRWPITPEGRSIYWGSLNRNKRSVTLNLRSDEGREIAQALITAPGENAGVFVENSVGRAFLDDDVLRAKREDLIHVRVQGSADGGPGVDYTVNAESGIPTITGQPGSDRPVNHTLPAWDLLCGQLAATAVLTGLLHRRATGKGMYEEIALGDTAFAAIADLGWYTEALQPDGERTKHGNHIFGTFGSDFRTADDRYIMITAITRRQWHALVGATGLTEVVEALGRTLGADFDQEADRYAHREVLESLLKPWFASRTAAEALAGLEGSGALYAPYSTIPEVAQKAAGTLEGTPAVEPKPQPALHTIESEALGTMLVGASPIRIDGEYLRAEKPAAFGADTEAVLSEKLGLSTAELGRLQDEGVIAS